MKKNHWNRKSRVRLSLKTNEEQDGLGRWQMIGTSFGCWDFQTNQSRPHPVRGLKLLREPSFCYLRTIIVFQYRLSVGLRHSFHIIPLTETHSLNQDLSNDTTVKPLLYSLVNTFKWQICKKPLNILKNGAYKWVSDFQSPFNIFCHTLKFWNFFKIIGPY